MDLDPDLSALDSLGGFFVLRTAVSPQGAQATLEKAYTTSRSDPDGDVYADPMTFRVRKVAQSLRAPEDRVAASIAHQALAARLWSIALGSAALFGRVPDLDARLLHWNPDAGAPDDLWPAEVRMLPAAAIGDVVQEGHLAPLAAALRSRYGVSAGLLRGNSGSALAGALRQLDRWASANRRADVADRAHEIAAGLFTHPELAGTLDPTTLRRRSCCLYYRLPGGGLCGDCCFDRRPQTRNPGADARP
ncbi:(2Fe-2S)-binding protein [Streptomyces sp. SAS_270]|uniref:(2Fe-2S)-binding protein n=1 Tax=Streptomyces sp. SAS_270 TaxID=3412748 RepID=UPI00403CCC54